jgi:pyridoxine/pyridoxamine 5'-phosphate oxidase
MMEDKLRSLLTEHEPKLAAVATATDKGRPAIAVLAYAVREDGTVIMSTHQSSHKWHNLETNPEIGFVVGWDFTHPHLQVGGDAQLLTGDAAKEVEQFFFAANPESKAFKTPDTGFIVVTPTWARITEFQAGGPPKVEEARL